MPMLPVAAETATVTEVVNLPEDVLLQVSVWIPVSIASSFQVFGSVKARVASVVMPDSENVTFQVGSKSAAALSSNGGCQEMPQPGAARVTGGSPLDLHVPTGVAGCYASRSFRLAAVIYGGVRPAKAAK